MATYSAPSKLTIDPTLTASVQESVLNVMNLLTGVTPETTILDQAISIVDGICGRIAYVGDTSWSMMVYCTRLSAMEVAAALAGFEMDYDHPDMGDAIGELANIFAGDIVARLDGQGIHVSMGLPSVFRGHDIEVLISKNTTSLWCAFEMPRSTFWVEIVAKPTRVTGAQGTALA